MKFVIGRTLTILSWDNPVTAFFRKSRKLRHSLGRPSRSDFVQFEVIEVETSGNVSVSVGGKKEEVKITEPGNVTLVFPKGLSFEVEICAENCAMTIDNVQLYSQIQQGYLYDENNKELECIAGIRVLNNSLE